jgi:bacterioferritin-associated ferredoxin
MIVCVCRGVSDREVRRHIDEGASCLQLLGEKRIGDCCGVCTGSLRELIAEQTARTGERGCSECCGIVAATA